MNTLKFVCREDELSYAKDAINSNNFVVYYYFDNSGLSYYLKKLQIDFCKDGYVCFYIDCAKEKNAAIQIAEQIIAGCNQAELKNFVRDKKEATKLSGMPVIKNTRIPVSLIVVCLKDEMTINEICEEYRLTENDIEEAMEYVIEILDVPYQEG